MTEGPRAVVRLRSDACFRCSATDVHLVMTGRVILGSGQESPILQCEPCFDLTEAARQRQQHSGTRTLCGSDARRSPARS
jgi:hypothetical protein